MPVRTGVFLFGATAVFFFRGAAFDDADWFADVVLRSVALREVRRAEVTEVSC